MEKDFDRVSIKIQKNPDSTSMVQHDRDSTKQRLDPDSTFMIHCDQDSTSLGSCERSSSCLLLDAETKLGQKKVKTETHLDYLNLMGSDDEDCVTALIRDSISKQLYDRSHSLSSGTPPNKRINFSAGSNLLVNSVSTHAYIASGEASTSIPSTIRPIETVNESRNFVTESHEFDINYHPPSASSDILLFGDCFQINGIGNPVHSTQLDAHVIAEDTNICNLSPVLNESHVQMDSVYETSSCQDEVPSSILELALKLRDYMMNEVADNTSCSVSNIELISDIGEKDSHLKQSSVVFSRSDSEMKIESSSKSDNQSEAVIMKSDKEMCDAVEIDAGVISPQPSQPDLDQSVAMNVKSDKETHNAVEFDAGGINLHPSQPDLDQSVAMNVQSDKEMHNAVEFDAGGINRHPSQPDLDQSVAMNVKSDKETHNAVEFDAGGINLHPSQPDLNQSVAMIVKSDKETHNAVEFDAGGINRHPSQPDLDQSVAMNVKSDKETHNAVEFDAGGINRHPSQPDLDQSVAMNVKSDKETHNADEFDAGRISCRPSHLESVSSSITNNETCLLAKQIQSWDSSFDKLSLDCPPLNISYCNNLNTHPDVDISGLIMPDEVDISGPMPEEIDISSGTNPNGVGTSGTNPHVVDTFGTNPDEMDISGANPVVINISSANPDGFGRSCTNPDVINISGAYPHCVNLSEAIPDDIDESLANPASDNVSGVLFTDSCSDFSCNSNKIPSVDLSDERNQGCKLNCDGGTVSQFLGETKNNYVEHQDNLIGDFGLGTMDSIVPSDDQHVVSGDLFKHPSDSDLHPSGVNPRDTDEKFHDSSLHVSDSSIQLDVHPGDSTVLSGNMVVHSGHLGHGAHSADQDGHSADQVGHSADQDGQSADSNLHSPVHPDNVNFLEKVEETTPTTSRMLAPTPTGKTKTLPPASVTMKLYMANAGLFHKSESSTNTSGDNTLLSPNADMKSPPFASPPSRRSSLEFIEAGSPLMFSPKVLFSHGGLRRPSSTSSLKRVLHKTDCSILSEPGISDIESSLGSPQTWASKDVQIKMEKRRERGEIDVTPDMVLSSLKRKPYIRSFSGRKRLCKADNSRLSEADGESLHSLSQISIGQSPDNSKLAEDNSNPDQKIKTPNTDHLKVVALYGKIIKSVDNKRSRSATHSETSSIASDLQPPSSVASDLVRHSSVASDVQPPTSVASDVQRPASLASDVQQPASAASDVQQPASVASDVQQPASVASDVQPPTSVASDVQRPASLASDVQQPASVASDVQQPASVASDVQQPASSVVKDEQHPASVASDKQQSILVASDVQRPVSIASDRQQPSSVASNKRKPVSVVSSDSLQSTSFASEQQHLNSVSTSLQVLPTVPQTGCILQNKATDSNMATTDIRPSRQNSIKRVPRVLLKSSSHLIKFGDFSSPSPGSSSDQRDGREHSTNKASTAKMTRSGSSNLGEKGPSIEFNSVILQNSQESHLNRKSENKLVINTRESINLDKNVSLEQSEDVATSKEEVRRGRKRKAVNGCQKSPERSPSTEKESAKFKTGPKEDKGGSRFSKRKQLRVEKQVLDDVPPSGQVIHDVEVLTESSTTPLPLRDMRSLRRNIILPKKIDAKVFFLSCKTAKVSVTEKLDKIAVKSTEKQIIDEKKCSDSSVKEGIITPLFKIENVFSITDRVMLSLSDESPSSKDVAQRLVQQKKTVSPCFKKKILSKAKLRNARKIIDSPERIDKMSYNLRNATKLKEFLVPDDAKKNMYAADGRSEPSISSNRINHPEALELSHDLVMNTSKQLMDVSCDAVVDSDKTSKILFSSDEELSSAIDEPGALSGSRAAVEPVVNKKNCLSSTSSKYLLRSIRKLSRKSENLINNLIQKMEDAIESSPVEKNFSELAVRMEIVNLDPADTSTNDNICFAQNIQTRSQHSNFIHENTKKKSNAYMGASKICANSIIPVIANASNTMKPPQTSECKFSLPIPSISLRDYLSGNNRSSALCRLPGTGIPLKEYLSKKIAYANSSPGSLIPPSPRNSVCETSPLQISTRSSIRAFSPRTISTRKTTCKPSPCHVLTRNSISTLSPRLNSPRKSAYKIVPCPISTRSPVSMLAPRQITTRNSICTTPSPCRVSTRNSINTLSSQKILTRKQSENLADSKNACTLPVNKGFEHKLRSASEKVLGNDIIKSRSCWSIR